MNNVKKIVLPRLTLTKVSDIDCSDAVFISDSVTPYIVQPLLEGTNSLRRDGKPSWSQSQFNLFPIVVSANRVPWAEANIYILSRLENQIEPNMTTYTGIADDLGAFRHFLDEYEIDWMCFPENKLLRPTYRFNGHLKFVVKAGELSVRTAKRRMGSVISFYRWLISEGAINPEHIPWKESDCYIVFQGGHGFSLKKKVKTTDVAIKVPKQDDPYDERIDDGGKLRPLHISEQEQVIKALVNFHNTEMTLIHLFGLLTGARIQTILTFRVRHAILDIDELPEGDIRFPVGPGTGVDTKNDKRLVLHIPKWFYIRLQVYANSERSRGRRFKAKRGDSENQYLFLSQRGNPLYTSKQDAASFDSTNVLRYSKSGQGVRQFLKERVIPYVRKKQGFHNFHYRFHDLRATAGMNWTDHQLKLVEKGEITLHEAREFIKTRMGHESSATTDKYLRYRKKLEQIRSLEKSFESHLQVLAQRALDGIE